MQGYQAIARVSERLIAMLQEELVPDFIPQKDKIGLCNPADRGDTAVGIYLYDIMENEDIARGRQMYNSNDRRMIYPPIYLNLYYMITPYFMGNVRYRTMGEHETLGRIIQYLHDYPIISIDSIDKEDKDGIDLKVELLRLDMEQKSRIWNYTNEPYRTSLFYRISPVIISSDRYKSVERVKVAQINVDDKYEGGGR